MSKNKKIIIMSIILMLGVGISTFAYITLQRSDLKAQETKSIVVLNRDINPYETIGTNDLKNIEISINADTTGYVTEKYQLAGLVASSYLVSDEPVPELYVVEKEKINHIKFVTLKTDYTRSGGAKVGDSVDIYRVIQETKETSSETILLGENAIIVNVTDKEGTSVFGRPTSSSIVGGEKKIPIQAIKLAIDSKKIDVKKIVEASVNGDNYVLVVKNNGTSSSLALGGK